MTFPYSIFSLQKAALCQNFSKVFYKVFYLVVPVPGLFCTDNAKNLLPLYSISPVKLFLQVLFMLL